MPKNKVEQTEVNGQKALTILGVTAYLLSEKPPEVYISYGCDQDFSLFKENWAIEEAQSHLKTTTGGYSVNLPIGSALAFVLLNGIPFDKVSSDSCGPKGAVHDYIRIPFDSKSCSICII